MCSCQISTVHTETQKMAEQIDDGIVSSLHNDLGNSSDNQMKEINDNCHYYTTLDKYQVGNFSILHMNVRSIKNKLDELQHFLIRSDIQWDIICLSETWLKNDIIKYYELENYNVFASCRTTGEGGGTAIYVNVKHHVIERKDLESTEFEANFVQVKLNCDNITRSIIIGEMYRPPSSLSSNFLSYLEKVLDTVANERKFAIIAGDFNYNTLQEKNKGSRDFVNLFTSYSFYPMISRATRIQNESIALLDNIFINDLSFYYSSGVFSEDISDHFPIFFSFHFTKTDHKDTQYVTTFNYHKLQELNDFLQLQLTDFQKNNNANIASEQLLKAYSDGINAFSKKYKPCRRKSSIKPWITAGILAAINTKTKLYNKFMRRRNVQNENKYKKHRNILVHLIRNAKALYFKSKLEENKLNSKKTWMLLNQIINKTNNHRNNVPESFIDTQDNICSKADIPEGFNDFFSSIGQKLDSEIPKTNNDPLNYLMQGDYEPFTSTLQTSPSQVENIIKSLNSVGGGIDRISTRILLGTYKSILSHLTFFFNLCLKTSVFPNNLKVAIIKPLYKSGRKDRFTNYRPISLLPILSKILEKLLHATLSNFLDENNILNDLQFGFRKGYSTYMPIAHMHNEITQNLEKNHLTCTLYLDLKKAFDTVSTEILLKKLYFIGIRGSLYDILKSYLEDRYQITKVNDECSSKKKINLGVPQGSILGPLLFILYIDDLRNITNLANFYMFADDTAIMIKARNSEHLQSVINEVMPLVTKWFQTSRLSLNVQKTHYQIYSMLYAPDIDIFINAHKIERKHCVKYLGIHIDENLKWKSHIESVASTLSSNIGVMGRAKYLLSSRELILLYNSLVLPYLNYCVAIWGRNYPSNIKKLKLLQKRAVRIVDKKPYIYPTNSLFIKYNLLKFDDIVREQCMMILLAYLNNTLPCPIAKLFKYQEPSITRQCYHFATPKAQSNYRLFSLSCSAPRIWNNIVGSMFKQINDVPKNKLTLKKHIRKYFIDHYVDITKT